MNRTLITFFRVFLLGHIRLALAGALALALFPAEALAVVAVAIAVWKALDPFHSEIWSVSLGDPEMFVPTLILLSFVSEQLATNMRRLMYWLEGQRYRLLTRLGIFGRTIDLLGLLSPTLLAGYVIYSAHGSLLDLSFDKVLGKPSFNARLIVALLVAQLAAILRRIHISRRNRSSGASHALPSAMRPFSSRAFAIDGDTLAAGDIRIRIHGMDAPETEQSGGPESRQHLQSMIDGKILDFVPLKIDRYNRTVATVYCAGVDIGEAMVRDGYAIAAYASRNKLGDQLYAHAEQEAKATRAGLWGRLGAVPSPESFRHAG